MTKPKRAPRRPPSAEPKRGRGRPTTYRPEYVEQVRKLAKLGATDAQIADFFGCVISTIFLWRAEHPEFSEASKVGKIEADEAVERSLYHRALGYSHEAVKIMTVSEGHLVGARIEEVPYVEHYPPDTAAAIFWLKNRQPQRWRDRPVGDGEDDDLARARRIKSALAEIEDTFDRRGTE